MSQMELFRFIAWKLEIYCVIRGCPYRTSAVRGEGVSSDTVVRTFWCKKHRIFEIYL